VDKQLKEFILKRFGQMEKGKRRIIPEIYLVNLFLKKKR